MKDVVKILICLIFFLPQLWAQPEKWAYDNRYHDQLLYLHSMANYVLSVEDDFLFESGLYKGTAIRMSFGSVEINDLLSDFRMQLRQPLNTRFWFILNQRYYASQHWDMQSRRLDLGFEMKLWNGFSAFFYGKPAFEKEEADVQFGLGWMGQNGEQYIRLAATLDDPFYESKNSLAGIDHQLDMGLRWQIRLPVQDCWFYCAGKLSKGIQRSYPNIQKSPWLNKHNRMLNHCTSKLYYRFANEALLEIAIQYYDFQEEKQFSSSMYDYLYQNKVWLRSLRYALPVTQRQQVRFALRCVTQEAEADGWHNYTYERTELMPALFYKYQYKQFLTEFGYLGSAFDWDYADAITTQNYQKKEWTEKLKLGFGYQFSAQSRLEVSLSHVITYWGFGGGNLQFVMAL